MIQTQTKAQKVSPSGTWYGIGRRDPMHCPSVLTKILRSNDATMLIFRRVKNKLTATYRRERRKVWNDLAEYGYTVTEIAKLTLGSADMAPLVEVDVQPPPYAQSHNHGHRDGRDPGSASNAFDAGPWNETVIRQFEEAGDIMG